MYNSDALFHIIFTFYLTQYVLYYILSYYFYVHSTVDIFFFKILYNIIFIL